MRGMLRSSAKLIILGVGLAALAASAETAGPPTTSQPRAYLLRNVRIWDGRGAEVSAGPIRWINSFCLTRVPAFSKFTVL